MIGAHQFPHLFVKLHWRPIHSRIKFKISSLTFKLLSDNQPENLRSLLTPYAPPRLLRSSDKCLLTQPRTSTSIGKRVFNVCAPAVWNSIPLHIRLSPSLASFKRNLKTLYFAPSQSPRNCPCLRFSHLYLLAYLFMD